MLAFEPAPNGADHTSCPVDESRHHTEEVHPLVLRNDAAAASHLPHGENAALTLSSLGSFQIALPLAESTTVSAASHVLTRSRVPSGESTRQAGFPLLMKDVYFPVQVSKMPTPSA